MVLEEFHVVVPCPACGMPAETWPEDMPSADLAAETAHDAESEQEIEIECGSCAQPFSVTVRAHLGGWEAFQTGDPHIKGNVEHFDYRADEEPSPEPGPYGIFLETIEGWRFNVLDLAETDGGSSRNRMLFTTLFSIVEAYLSDAIIGVALSDVNVQKRMLRLDGLKDKQVSLSTVLDNPDIVRDMVKAMLQSLSFHNLRYVSRICEEAFGRPILPRNAADRAFVIKAVDKRHDCVHRNGSNRDGERHTDITEAYLRRLGDIFVGMATALEAALQEALVKRFFHHMERA